MTTTARLAGGIMVSLLLWATAAAGECVPQRGHYCLSLDRLPEISRQIIAREPLAPPAKPQPAAAASPAPYTGPTVGVSNMVRRAPTVGYRWSLE